MTAAMNRDLQASYAHCAAVARREARNFYPSFLLLPADRRRSMCALYALQPSDRRHRRRARRYRDQSLGPSPTGANLCIEPFPATPAPGPAGPPWPIRSPVTASPNATSIW